MGMLFICPITLQAKNRLQAYTGLTGLEKKLGIMVVSISLIGHILGPV